MKIVLISEYFPTSEKSNLRGGVETRCLNIAKRLALDNDVIVVTSRAAGAENEQTIFKIRVLRIGPIHTYTHSRGLWARFCFFWSIIFLKMPWKPDIIDAQAIITYIPAYILAKRYKAKSVITLHDMWLGRWVRLFGWMGCVGELYERLFLRLRWDGCIANSQYTLNKLPEWFNPSRRVVIYNGLDHFIQMDAVPYQRNSICIISRLVSYKRVNDVLEACALLQKQGMQVFCNIIGSGPAENTLKQFCEESKLTERVIFHGFVPHHKKVLEILQSSQVFCLASEVEGFGIVILEAAQAGRPYICTDIPALREVTHGGLGGTLVPVGNISSFANAIRSFFSNQQFYTVKCNELEHLKKFYKWDVLGKQCDMFYSDLMKNHAE